MATKLMNPECRIDNIRVVFEIVERVLADPKGDVSEEFCYVRDHIDRLFVSTIGETLKQFTLRMRLERAAFRLSTRQGRVIDVAIEAGYFESEAFIKSFRSRYGLPPGKFRDRWIPDWHLQSPIGLHWGEPVTLPVGSHDRVQRRPDVSAMVIPIVGDYIDIPRKWGELARDLPSSLLEQPPISIFHDNGYRNHDRQKMLAHLGFIFSGGVVPYGFEVVTIPSGLFVTTRPTISSEDHSQLWRELNQDWIGKNRRPRRFQPGYDEYSSVPSDWQNVNASLCLGI